MFCLYLTVFTVVNFDRTNGNSNGNVNKGSCNGSQNGNGNFCLKYGNIGRATSSEREDVTHMDLVRKM